MRREKRKKPYHAMQVTATTRRDTNIFISD